MRNIIIKLFFTALIIFKSFYLTLISLPFQSYRESIERVFVAGLTPFLAKQLQLQLQQLQQPKVNFKDIGDISKSSRDTQQVSADRNAMVRELKG